MECPGCQAMMNSERYEELPIQHCPTCGGVWMTDNTLILITRRREQQIDPKVLEDVVSRPGLYNAPDYDRNDNRDLTCPRCQSELKLANYGYSSGILVDTCPAGCGLFLDDRELEMIQAWVEKYDDQVDQLDAYYMGLARHAEGRTMTEIGGFGHSIGAFVYGLPGALAGLIRWAREKKKKV